MFLIVAALSTAAGLGYVYSRSTEIQRVELGDVLTAEPVEDTDPQNFLIIGLDNAPEGDPGHREGLAGQRSDTIMVLRADPRSEEASLLSLPRDLYVSIPGFGRDRINAAVHHGGPELLIGTITENFDIPIHHYVALDFDGFQRLVDLVGGVSVYFPDPARDRKSGLDVPEAGCVVLTPEQALAYARSRSYEFRRDGRWHTDGTGDLGRISRQQDFIRRALHQAISRGARNPVVLRDLVEAGLDSVVVDDDVTIEGIVGLGQRFRSFNADTLALHSLPVVDDVAGGAEVLLLVERAAEPILDIFRGGPSTGELQPGAVRAVVQNGTGQPGLAGGAAADLRAAGFTIPPDSVGDAERFDVARTLVRYEPGFESRAELLERYLVGGADLEPVDDLDSGPVVLVVGSDWAGVLDEPRAPAPGDADETTTTAGEDDDTGPTTTPPTTVVGEVPQAPPDVDC